MPSKDLHPDFLQAKRDIYIPSGLTVTEEEPEQESQEYGAARFMLDHQAAIFRVGKITPTKVGHFVTIWKRDENGITAPFDILDPIDLIVISTRGADSFGQFVFPKSLLVLKGYISRQKKGGKRAIRVYPPWIHNLNSTAQKTKAWQLPYFFTVPTQGAIDSDVVRKLFLPRKT